VTWIRRAGLLVELLVLTADCIGLPAVTLVGRDELDDAVETMLILPGHKSLHPAASFYIAIEWPSSIDRPLLGLAEQGCEKGTPAKTTLPKRRLERFSWDRNTKRSRTGSSSWSFAHLCT
jgi:hypothetical protein